MADADDGQQRPRPKQRSLLDRIVQIGVLLTVLLLVIFLLQNLQEVEVHFLWFEWRTRMIWALIGSSAIGALGLFLTSFVVARRRGAPKT